MSKRRQQVRQLSQAEVEIRERQAREDATIDAMCEESAAHILSDDLFAAWIREHVHESESFAVFCGMVDFIREYPTSLRNGFRVVRDLAEQAGFIARYA